MKRAIQVVYRKVCMHWYAEAGLSHACMHGAQVIGQDGAVRRWGVVIGGGGLHSNHLEHLPYAYLGWPTCIPI